MKLLISATQVVLLKCWQEIYFIMRPENNWLPIVVVEIYICPVDNVVEVAFLYYIKTM